MGKGSIMQHSIGELIIYGTSGVCRIEDIREENFTGVARAYYILRPTDNTCKSKIFVPVDNEALVAMMHKLLSPKELLAVTRATPCIEADKWPQDGRARNKTCKELLASGERASLIALVKTISQAGYKPTAAEESACLRAATMLYEEFSLIFNLSFADTIPTIMGEIEPKSKE